MSRAPLLVVATLPAAAVAWTLHLATAPEPLAIDAALTIALGLVMFTVISAAGILLARGRWSRWLARGVISAEAVLFVVTDATAQGYVAAGVSAASLVGIEGPWLDGWVRTRPSAEGPGPIPVGVVLGAVALVPLVAVASPGGLTTWHGVLGAAGAVLGWSYARAMPWSLWALRLTLPIVAVPAIVLSPPAGGALLAGSVLAVTVLAWSRQSLLAIHPLFDRLPGPRSRSSGRGTRSGGSGD